MKSPGLAIAACLALAGCALKPVAAPPAVFDLGLPARSAAAADAGTMDATGATSAPGWRLADVTAPPWLDGDGIAYRLAYAQAQQRQQYRDSRWAAPPAQLLTQRLREQLAAPSSCAGRPPGLLAVHLDAFEQVFSAPRQAHVVLRVQASWWPAGTPGAALQQRWQLERPSAPDAAGAAQALGQAVEAWLPQLERWAAAAACR